MPEKILNLLEKGSLTELQLATLLEISADELRAYLEYLQQMGFLKSTLIHPTGGCSGNCGKCHASCNTAHASGYRIWEIP